MCCINIEEKRIERQTIIRRIRFARLFAEKDCISLVNGITHNMMFRQSLMKYAKNKEIFSVGGETNIENAKALLKYCMCLYFLS